MKDKVIFLRRAYLSESIYVDNFGLPDIYVYNGKNLLINTKVMEKILRSFLEGSYACMNFNWLRLIRNYNR